jgi:DNA-binding transcriptional ArsR family regulator
MHISACQYVWMNAERIARTMAGLSTASRVRILVRLRQGPSTVSGLTGAVGMTQPAVSHQLRILRDLGMVVGRRDGRQIVYSLHDAHVARLLDESIRHVDRLDKADTDSG